MRRRKRLLFAGLDRAVADRGTACPHDRGPEEPESGNTFTVDRTDDRPPQADPNELPADDTLESTTARLGPDLVGRRPREAWRVNPGGSVLRLDVPMVRPDVEPALPARGSSSRGVAP